MGYARRVSLLKRSLFLAAVAACPAVQGIAIGGTKISVVDEAVRVHLNTLPNRYVKGTTWNTKAFLLKNLLERNGEIEGYALTKNGEIIVRASGKDKKGKSIKVEATLADSRIVQAFRATVQDGVEHLVTPFSAHFREKINSTSSQIQDAISKGGILEESIYNPESGFVKTRVRTTGDDGKPMTIELDVSDGRILNMPQFKTAKITTVQDGVTREIEENLHPLETGYSRSEKEERTTSAVGQTEKIQQLIVPEELAKQAPNLQAFFDQLRDKMIFATNTPPAELNELVKAAQEFLTRPLEVRNFGTSVFLLPAGKGRWEKADSLDISPSQIRLSRADGSKRGVSGEWYVHSADNQPFARGEVYNVGPTKEAHKFSVSVSPNRVRDSREKFYSVK